MKLTLFLLMTLMKNEKRVMHSKTDNIKALIGKERHNII